MPVRVFISYAHADEAFRESSTSNSQFCVSPRLSNPGMTGNSSPARSGMRVLSPG